MTSSAIVCLCGVPAAGKSSLARYLLARGPDKLRVALLAPAIRLWHICFDEVFLQLKRESGSEEFDPEVWHRARKRVLQAVETYFGGKVGASAFNSIARCAQVGDPDDACVDIVLLDDNMHYRSMRRAYYRVAREARLAFCSICLPVTIATAVSRDAQRAAPHHVGRATIEAMAEALQWPEPERFPWEGSAIHVESWEQHGTGVDDADEAPWEPAFWAQLCDALRSPVEAEATGGLEAAARAMLSAASAAQTAESVGHQLDIRLRRIITAHMKSADVLALPCAARALRAKAVSERKKETLMMCKQRLAADANGDGEGDVEAAVDELELQFASGLKFEP